MKNGILYIAIGLMFFSSASVSVAEPHARHGNAMKGDHGQMHGAKARHKTKHKKGGTFSPHWVKTLTEEQKISFDKMHLIVGQFEAVQRAKMKMLKAELNVLAAKSANKKSAIYEKIDEILDVKKSIMRNRFDHIAEMRRELTEQQRISYDMGLLKRGKHKH